MLPDWIYNTPALIVTLLFSAIGVAASCIGVVTSYACFRRKARAPHGELISFTVTNIAVLYTVLLAFIAVATWQNLTTMQAIVDTEANHAGHVFLDAGGFAQPVAGEIRESITHYIDTVIQQEWPLQRRGIIPKMAGPYLDQIRNYLDAYEPTTAGKVMIMQQLISDMNQLDGARASRLQAINGHIPQMVWVVIMVVGALTVGYSCLLRAESLCVHLAMVGGLTLALTLVVTMIIQLDYPFRGQISVTPDAFEASLQTITAHQGKLASRNQLLCMGLCGSE